MCVCEFVGVKINYQVFLDGMQEQKAKLDDVSVWIIGINMVEDGVETSGLIVFREIHKILVREREVY